MWVGVYVCVGVVCGCVCVGGCVGVGGVCVFRVRVDVVDVDMRVKVRLWACG